ncbi:MAG TPA: hypothetical protein VFE07_09535 [Marmoricola sp.]|nr:hypothetical protein [Marmoricola sp.]
MRTTVILSSLVLATSLVAGCGSSGGDNNSAGGGYCKDLKSAKDTFDSFNSSSPNFDKLDEAFKTLHKLADEAPSTVDDDWKTLDGALTTMEKALSDAGLKATDLGKITAGQLPEGMTAEQLQAAVPKLQSAFSSFDSDKVKTATDAIEKHAKSVCKVSLAD